MQSKQLPPYIKLKNANGTETTHYSIFYDGVPNEFKKMAQSELNETEEKKRRGMQRLREVLQEEDISKISDQILLGMLRKCKYDIHKAEKNLIKFLKTRNMVLEKLRKADMKRLDHVLDHCFVGALPYRDAKGRAILFTTPINVNLELYDMQDALICYLLVFLFLVSSPMTSIAGVVYIGDCKTPTIVIVYEAVKLFRQYLGQLISFPSRIAHIEVLNELFIVRWTANIIKPLLPAKFVERISFYGSNVKNMQKNYHPELLPEEFGGTMGPLSNAFFKEEFFNFIKRLKNE